MKRLALLLLAFTGLMSACSKDDPVPQDGSLTPDSPEGREAVTIPDEFLRTYLLKYFDFDRNGELSRYEASLVVRIDCPGNINAGEGAYMCDATGIEACTNLRYLNLSGNDLTKLDVSNNKLLDTLDCGMRVASLPDYRMALESDALAFSLVEGWRGEVCHVGITGSDGQFRQYKIYDPSLHNWTALALSVRGAGISDFPICNKSFNLSYCGHDL
jgi:hypothetical protein